MKEKKYRDDWLTEVSMDPETGKEHRTPLYQGQWHHLASDIKKQASMLLSLGLIGFGVMWVLYMMLDFPGTRTLYVFLPLACAVFPAAYWVMGLFTLFRLPEKMTRLQREKSFSRILHSAAGLSIFLCIALVGDIVLIVHDGLFPQEGPGFILILCAACISFLSAMRCRQYLLNVNTD